MAKIGRERLARGVLTASAGNMAQGVAWCARERGVPCTVIAPDTAPEATFQDRAYPGVDGTFIHAFDDPDVMAGNATIGLEILEDLPDVESIVIPWGGGGLASGIGSAVRALAPACRLITAEAESGAPLAASLAAGSPQVVNYRASFVDGIGSRSVFPQMFERAQALIDSALVATLAEVTSALALMAERNHVIAEGAGACPVACALSGRAGSGKVVCVVSGGNIDADRLCAALRGEVPS